MEKTSLFFRRVTYCYGRRSILITTNNPLRNRTDLLAGDKALTTATLDRLLHKAQVLSIKERSYRQRDLEQTLSAQST